MASPSSTTASPPADNAYVVDPAVHPLPGFALAAEAAVRYLSRHVAMDLWLVTQIDGDEQRVVAGCGNWLELAPPEAVFPFPASLCLQMLQGAGPCAAPDVQAVPAYAAVAVGARAAVRSYLGVPLLKAHDEVFGTLCGFAGTRRGKNLVAALDLVQFTASMLSTVLTREAFAVARSTEAAHAYTLADTEPLTGLRNRRGWQQALTAETARCRRYASPGSVLSLHLTDLPPIGDAADTDVGDAQLRQCAAVLRETCRPTDVVAHPARGHFAVIAVGCAADSAETLLGRIAGRVRDAGLAAAVSVAARRMDEDLAETWHRARATVQPGAAADR